MLQRPEFNTPEDITLWLNSKDPGERFDWASGARCACAQYVKARGQYSSPDYPSWHGPVAELNNMLGKLATRLNPRARGNAPLWLTFGQAAEEWERYRRFFDRKDMPFELNEQTLLEGLMTWRLRYNNERRRDRVRRRERESVPA